MKTSRIKEWLKRKHQENGFFFFKKKKKKKKESIPSLNFWSRLLEINAEVAKTRLWVLPVCAQLSVSVRPDCVATVLHTSRVNLLLLIEKEQINMAVPWAQIINSHRTKNYVKPADENNYTLSTFLGHVLRFGPHLLWVIREAAPKPQFVNAVGTGDAKIVSPLLRMQRCERLSLFYNE